MSSDCIFCKIIQGDIPSEKIHETKHVYVFKDINPVAPVHLLIIPKKHITSISDISKDDSQVIVDLMESAKYLGNTIEELNKNYRIISSTGSDAGQVVKHLHFHLIGGRTLNWPPG
jgi:histidine triad (HIT) family protein